MSERSHRDWAALAERIEVPALAWIEGPVAALSGETRPSVDPATGRVLADVAECGVADVDLAVASARRAFDDGRWSHAHPRERAAVLTRWAELVLANADQLAAGQPGRGQADRGHRDDRRARLRRHPARVRREPG
ncbi:aldehyde dehydrogenase family protein [Nocardioides sp. Iso805N]|uniref:aldehyde dehydrogenase family protein n=1 Tax=Nocardioides sp. Iso805N TaxID=1283287 RepID=UPI0003A09E8E